MNAKSLVMLIAVLVTAGAWAVPQASAQNEGGWDAAICEGTEGVVVRDVNATTSDLPMTEGCDEDDTMGWLVVEPWKRGSGENPSEFNPDRACFSATWNETGDTGSVVSVFRRMGWNNGSVWRVGNDVAENPLVVSCEEVTTHADLGLNPGEGQLELRLARATIMRANELLNTAGTTMSEYAEEYPDDPISELFLLLSILSMGASN